MERHMLELLAFKKAHGHCEVPVNYKENPNLAKWVRTIRGSRTTRKMSAERMKELVKIGLRHGRDPSTGLAFGMIDSPTPDKLRQSQELAFVHHRDPQEKNGNDTSRISSLSRKLKDIVKSPRTTKRIQI
jgi:hypothetical protein